MTGSVEKRTAKRKHNNPYLAHGAVATAFALVSAVFSLVLGICLVSAFGDFIVEYGEYVGSLSILSFVISLVAFGLGIAAMLANMKLAYISAISSLLAVMLTVCSLAVAGFDGYSIIWEAVICLSAIVSAFGLVSFILFGVYRAKAPLKTVYFSNTKRKKKAKDREAYSIALTVKRIARLNELYSDGVLTADEFDEQKKLLLAAVSDKDRAENTNTGDITPLSKRKILLMFFIPVLIFAVIGGGVFSGIRISCYEAVYDEIVYEMSNMSSVAPALYWSFRSHKSERKMQYLLYDLLPNDYKDTSKIKTDYELITDWLSLSNDYSQNGSAVRAAYKNLLASKQELDSRWNFEEICEIAEPLLYDGKWLCDDKYITFRQSATTQSQLFFTNLPNAFSNEDDNSLCYHTAKRNGAVVIGYQNYAYNYESYRIYDFKYDSMSDTYSIKVYCYYNGITYTMTLNREYN